MKRSKANLSNYRLMSAEMGRLLPVQVQEVLPGDTFRISSSALIRFTPMLAPVMHPITVRLHHWFVPNRLLWDGWEEFITGGADGQNADTVPTITTPDPISQGYLLDYLGIPLKPNLSVSALPLRAYNMIYNEFYRDQDLVDEYGIDDMSLKYVSWRKDYFTASRPFPQKGADIVLPIGTEAPVVANDPDPTMWISRSGEGARSVKAQESSGNLNLSAPNDSTIDALPNMIADLSQATGVTATQFREFFALQRYAEARARYGSRYTEYLRYLGVTPSDSRLQRPEYLGGGKATIQFSEVLQTAADVDNNTPIGTLRGHGIGAIKAKPTRRFFEEHGIVLTLMSIVPKSIYNDGMQRLFLRQDKEDFYQKELQSIGQQTVKLGEVYAEAGTEHDLFGYQDRYSEYLSTPSLVNGYFKTTDDFWHFARKFDQAPVLDANFTDCVPTKRPFATTVQHPLQVMVNNQVVARRLVKRRSVGRLM